MEGVLKMWLSASGSGYLFHVASPPKTLPLKYKPKDVDVGRAILSQQQQSNENLLEKKPRLVCIWHKYSERGNFAD